MYQYCTVPQALETLRRFKSSESRLERDMYSSTLALLLIKVASPVLQLQSSVVQHTQSFFFPTHRQNGALLALAAAEREVIKWCGIVFAVSVSLSPPLWVS